MLMYCIECWHYHGNKSDDYLGSICGKNIYNNMGDRDACRGLLVKIELENNENELEELKLKNKLYRQIVSCYSDLIELLENG